MTVIKECDVEYAVELITLMLEKIINSPIELTIFDGFICRLDVTENLDLLKKFLEQFPGLILGTGDTCVVVNFRYLKKGGQNA